MLAGNIQKLVDSSETTKVKLNLGCGDFLLGPPYINVDRRTPDAYVEGQHQLMVWDLSQRKIPRPSDTVDYIVCHHFLEHLTYEQGQRLIDDCFRVLKKGGVMTLVTPDFNFLVKQYLNSRPSLRPNAELMLFCEGPDGDKHRSAYDQVTLKQLAWGAGFEVDEVTPVSEYPNLVANVPWQCGIRCIKP